MLKEQIINQIVDTIKNNQMPHLVDKHHILTKEDLDKISEKLNSHLFVMSMNDQEGENQTSGDFMDTKIAFDKKKGVHQVYMPEKGTAIQESIDYAKKHPDETPVLVFKYINELSYQITNEIFDIIHHDQLGTADVPENLKIMFIQIPPLDVTEGAVRIDL